MGAETNSLEQGMQQIKQRVIESFSQLGDFRNDDGSLSWTLLCRALAALDPRISDDDAQVLLDHFRESHLVLQGSTDNGDVRISLRSVMDFIFDQADEEEALSAPLKCKSVDDLRAHLQRAQIPLPSWGSGKAKSVQHLFKELQEGSSELLRNRATGVITRVVEPVFVEICFGGKVLVEQRQWLNDGISDGQCRERNLLLAEKRNPSDADIEATAKRGLAEELNIVASNDGEWPLGVVYKAQDYQRFEKASMSDSFPGLQCNYIYHHLRIDFVAPTDGTQPDFFASCGLPDCKDFHTEEPSHKGTMKHLWSWVDAETARQTVRGYPGRV
eukprot:TRINITY_DN12666_c0_g1_i2.p1 TRINITY_DN12666_c0_g1~~TRINITY_DN12666_c0_g1_i2.p1  ORF type:complete len:352 (-),score=77.73 TRINITY_DN12666_c0_g1_i2:143-1129(-)